MKFAHFSHVWNKPGMTAAQRYEQLWRELATCDELGFDFGFTVEHHFNPNESWMPSPSIYCTGAAARTRRMRHGPMGFVAPLYDPLRIAEDAAVLDNILNGRLELGLVAGIVPDFFGPYRADFKNRRALTHEALRFVKRALASEAAFNFDGPVHQYQDVTLSVKPLQKPHPPLWVHSRDPDTLAFLAQEGAHTGYLFLVPRATKLRRAIVNTFDYGARRVTRGSRILVTGCSSTWTRLTTKQSRKPRAILVIASPKFSARGPMAASVTSVSRKTLSSGTILAERRSPETRSTSITCSNAIWRLSDRRKP